MPHLASADESLALLKSGYSNADHLAKRNAAVAGASVHLCDPVTAEKSGHDVPALKRMQTLSFRGQSTAWFSYEFSGPRSVRSFFLPIA